MGGALMPLGTACDVYRIGRICQMDERLQQYDNKMQKSYDNLLEEFGSIRAGRANPHVLDKIRVDYYGTPTVLQQVANISVPEPRMLLIQPWEPLVL